MSYHIISIDEEGCRLSVSRGQFCMQTGACRRSVPLEDVASIVISAYRCELSLHFLTRVALEGIGLVLCEQGKPAALLLPASRATDTALLRHLGRMPPQLSRRLWSKTVTAKCANQAAVAEQWNPAGTDIAAMRQLALGDKDFREAETARLYWRNFAATVAAPDFRRGRGAGGFNALLNYAYAVLLSFVMGRLFAVGLDPCFGIHHCARARSAPLAYDLMEPFRPLFDAQVMRWIEQMRAEGKSDAEAAEISTAYRRHILSTLLLRVDYRQESHELRHVIELVLRSFRAAVLAGQSSPYEPWTLSTIKWDGSSSCLISRR